MIKVNPKIEPLREDLGHLIPDRYFLTTVFKRWVISENLQNVWQQCLDYSKRRQNVIVLGYSDVIEVRDAMTVLLNHIFENNKNQLPQFIFKLLTCYSNSEHKQLDVTDIRNDFFQIVR